MCSDVFSQPMDDKTHISIKLIATNKTYFRNKQIKFAVKSDMTNELGLPINFGIKHDFITLRTDVHQKIDLFLGYVLHGRSAEESSLDQQNDYAITNY